MKYDACKKMSSHFGNNVTKHAHILYANFSFEMTTTAYYIGKSVSHITKQLPQSRLRCLRRFFLLLFTFTTQKQMVSSHAIKELLQFFHVTLSLWDDTFDKKFPLGTINCSRKNHGSILDINHKIKFIPFNERDSNVFFVHNT